MDSGNKPKEAFKKSQEERGNRVVFRATVTSFFALIGSFERSEQEVKKRV